MKFGWKLLGFAGIAAALVLFYGFEESRVARARTDAADARRELADAVNAHATAAADAARATARAAVEAQAQLDAQLAAERSVRSELAELERTAAQRRTAADRQIARLQRENTELAAWAATLVPGPWLAFVRGELTEPDAGPANR